MHWFHYTEPFGSVFSANTSAYVLQLHMAHTELGALSVVLCTAGRKCRDTAVVEKQKKTHSIQAFTSLTVPKIMLLHLRMNMLISDLHTLTKRLLFLCQKSIFRSLWMPEQNVWALPDDSTVRGRGRKPPPHIQKEHLQKKLRGCT